MSDSSLDRVRDWVKFSTGPIHTKDIEWLLREVEAVREYRGEFAVAHRRYTEATNEAARLLEENRAFKELVETFNAGTDLPLWRRIAMQRRSLRAMTSQVNMYRRWWLAEKSKND